MTIGGRLTFTIGSEINSVVILEKVSYEIREIIIKTCLKYRMKWKMSD